MADAEQRDATAPGTITVVSGGASAAEEDPVFMDDTAEATAARSGRLSTLSTLSADSDEFVPQAEAVDENGVQHATYRPRHAILPERSDEAVSDGDGNEWEPARAIRSSTKSENYFWEEQDQFEMASINRENKLFEGAESIRDYPLSYYMSLAVEAVRGLPKTDDVGMSDLREQYRSQLNPTNSKDTIASFVFYQTRLLPGIIRRSLADETLGWSQLKTNRVDHVIMFFSRRDSTSQMTSLCGFLNANPKTTFTLMHKDTEPAASRHVVCTYAKLYCPDFDVEKQVETKAVSFVNFEATMKIIGSSCGESDTAQHGGRKYAMVIDPNMARPITAAATMVAGLKDVDVFFAPFCPNDGDRVPAKPEKPLLAASLVKLDVKYWSICVAVANVVERLAGSDMLLFGAVQYKLEGIEDKMRAYAQPKALELCKFAIAVCSVEEKIMNCDFPGALQECREFQATDTYSALYFKASLQSSMDEGPLEGFRAYLDAKASSLESIIYLQDIGKKRILRDLWTPSLGSAGSSSASMELSSMSPEDRARWDAVDTARAFKMKQHHWQYVLTLQDIGFYYKENGDHHGAAAIYYRMIEWVMQYHFATKYGIDCNDSSEGKFMTPECRCQETRHLANDFVTLKKGFDVLRKLHEKDCANNRNGAAPVTLPKNVDPHLKTRNKSVLMHGYQKCSPDVLAKEAEKLLLRLRAASPENTRAYDDCVSGKSRCGINFEPDLRLENLRRERILTEQFAAIQKDAEGLKKRVKAATQRARGICENHLPITKKVRPKKTGLTKANAITTEAKSAFEAKRKAAVDEFKRLTVSSGQDADKLRTLERTLATVCPGETNLSLEAAEQTLEKLRLRSNVFSVHLAKAKGLSTGSAHEVLERVLKELQEAMTDTHNLSSLGRDPPTNAKGSGGRTRQAKAAPQAGSELSPIGKPGRGSLAPGSGVGATSAPNPGDAATPDAAKQTTSQSMPAAPGLDSSKQIDQLFEEAHVKFIQDHQRDQQMSTNARSSRSHSRASNASTNSFHQPLPDDPVTSKDIRDKGIPIHVLEDWRDKRVELKAKLEKEKGRHRSNKATLKKQLQQLQRQKQEWHKAKGHQSEASDEHDPTGRTARAEESALIKEIEADLLKAIDGLERSDKRLGDIRFTRDSNVLNRAILLKEREIFLKTWQKDCNAQNDYAMGFQYDDVFQFISQKKSNTANSLVIDLLFQMDDAMNRLQKERATAGNNNDVGQQQRGTRHHIFFPQTSWTGNNSVVQEFERQLATLLFPDLERHRKLVKFLEKLMTLDKKIKKMKDKAATADTIAKQIVDGVNDGIKADESVHAYVEEFMKLQCDWCWSVTEKTFNPSGDVDLQGVCDAIRDKLEGVIEGLRASQPAYFQHLEGLENDQERWDLEIVDRVRPCDLEIVDPICGQEPVSLTRRRFVFHKSFDCGADEISQTEQLKAFASGHRRAAHILREPDGNLGTESKKGKRAHQGRQDGRTKSAVFITTGNHMRTTALAIAASSCGQSVLCVTQRPSFAPSTEVGNDPPPQRLRKVDYDPYIQQRVLCNKLRALWADRHFSVAGQLLDDAPCSSMTSKKMELLKKLNAMYEKMHSLDFKGVVESVKLVQQHIQKNNSQWQYQPVSGEWKNVPKDHNDVLGGAPDNVELPSQTAIPAVMLDKRASPLNLETFMHFVKRDYKRDSKVQSVFRFRLVAGLIHPQEKGGKGDTIKRKDIPQSTVINSDANGGTLKHDYEPYNTALAKLKVYAAVAVLSLPPLANDSKNKEGKRVDARSPEEETMLNNFSKKITLWRFDEETGQLTKLEATKESFGHIPDGKSASDLEHPAVILVQIPGLYNKREYPVYTGRQLTDELNQLCRTPGGAPIFASAAELISLSAKELQRDKKGGEQSGAEYHRYEMFDKVAKLLCSFCGADRDVKPYGKKDFQTIPWALGFDIQIADLRACRTFEGLSEDQFNGVFTKPKPQKKVQERREQCNCERDVLHHVRDIIRHFLEQFLAPVWLKIALRVDAELTILLSDELGADGTPPSSAASNLGLEEAACEALREYQIILQECIARFRALQEFARELAPANSLPQILPAVQRSNSMGDIDEWKDVHGAGIQKYQYSTKRGVRRRKEKDTSASGGARGWRCIREQKIRLRPGALLESASLSKLSQILPGYRRVAENLVKMTGQGFKPNCALLRSRARVDILQQTGEDLEAHWELSYTLVNAADHYFQRKNFVLAQMCYLRLLHNIAAYNVGLQHGCHILELESAQDITRCIKQDEERAREVVEAFLTRHEQDIPPHRTIDGLTDEGKQDMRRETIVHDLGTQSSIAFELLWDLENDAQLSSDAPGLIRTMYNTCDRRDTDELTLADYAKRTIKELDGFVESRNNSVTGHGFCSPSSEECERLKAVAFLAFNALHVLEGAMRCPRPGESEADWTCAQSFDRSVFQRRFTCCLRGAEFDTFVSELLGVDRT